MARRNSEEAQIAVVAQVLEVQGSLKGMSFSITGHLGLARPEVVKLIEDAGGEFHKSPTYRTRFLITNADWNTGSTVASGTSKKLQAAEKNGTKIISERQFLSMLAKGETVASRSADE